MVRVSSADISDGIASYIRMQKVNPRDNGAVLRCVQRVDWVFGRKFSPEDIVSFLEEEDAQQTKELKKNGSSSRQKAQFHNLPRHLVCACRSGVGGSRR